ncbi:MAG: TRAP transporter large permease [Geminicoccaceae bacterium]|nr:TRAP transporter large permease [Geminicoccaceae bacterium]MDW8341032.1 TRAP transporter large permease [Geminicoccaceae bacterium]
MILLATFVLLLVMGVPIGFVLVGTTVAFVLTTGNFALLEALPQLMFSSLEVFDLLAIPLFILLGEIMNDGGVTRRLLEATRSWVRGLPRSLAYVNLVTNLLLASILGSANAQIAIMSRVIVPEMERAGYRRDFATALTAAAGLLGPIVPPSMVFIIYGVIAQVSIGTLFIAGILPGLILFAVMCTLISFLPAAAEREASGTVASRRAASRDVLAALAVPAVIVGGILSGAVTPTESAVVASAIALLVGAFVYRELRWRHAPDILHRTAANSAIVMFLIATAKILGWILTYYQIPQQTADFMRSLTEDPTVYLLLVFGLLVLVGTVIEGIAALIILVPILLPVAQGVYGIDPVHFGIVVCLTLILGLLTPPVGTGLYIAAAVTGTDIVRLSRVLVPFLLATAAVIVLVVLVPPLVTLRF